MEVIKRTIIFLILLPALHASSFFLPDSDSAALMAVVVNTSSTVANTLKLLNVAQETRGQLEKYHHIATRRYYLARRIEQHARDIAAIKKIKPQNLKEFNQALRRLKLNLGSLKSSVDSMGKSVVIAEDVSKKFYKKLENSRLDEQDVHNQEMSSAREGKMSTHVQNTAINTALNGKILSKIRRDNTEYRQAFLELQKSESLEKLRKDEFYRKWMGR